MAISFQVNGRNFSLTKGSPRETLLRFLREELRLTGTKDGCGQGHCGSCMVLLDGKPTRACLTKLTRIDGKKVETIEGLSKNGQLHPIQQALLEHNAAQCSFCIPGMVISAKALLDHKLSPSDEEIKQALALNLCRCGAYSKIIEAVRSAGEMMAGHVTHKPTQGTSPILSPLGVSVPDKDGLLKVTGGVTFADDMHLEGMLYGKILWSEYPHAEILAIDVSEAERSPGVEAVLTAKDVPGQNGFGLARPDQPALADKKVRYVGDPVAVVFAETADQAEKARNKIKVSYRELEGVFTTEQALELDAPHIHDDDNLLRYIKRTTGDPDKAMAEADVVVEASYDTPFVEHAYLEPEVALAKQGEDGRMMVWGPAQMPFESRGHIAGCLGVEEERVRVIGTPAGGGFGGKVDALILILAALGANHTHRPVKITLTRQESLRFSHKRHAFRMHYKTGAMKDGKLVAVQARMVADAGPYTTLSLFVLEMACLFSCGPYVVPNARIEGWAVCTNNANSGAFRGYGSNQPAFAIESQIDLLARELKMDPFEIRLLNAIEVGKALVSGEILRESAPMKETLLRAKAAVERMPAVPGKRVGIGVASGYKCCGLSRRAIDSAGANLELTPEGDILLRVSSVELGQGNRTVMSQIAAAALGVPYERVKIVVGDTDQTPKATGACGERTTFTPGNAVMYASEKLKSEMLRYVAEEYKASPDGLEIRGDSIVDSHSGQSLVRLADLGRFTAGEGETLRAEHYHYAPRSYSILGHSGAGETAHLPKFTEVDDRTPLPPDYRNFPTYSYSTAVAVVEVEEKTGKVTVRRIIVAEDVGKALHPENIRQQVEGASLMGMGYALSEGFFLENGIPLTNTLAKCHIPSIDQLPEIECLIIEDPEPAGPFGAKGFSETPMIPVTPAITNAIYDAVGVRINSLPATADKIREALHLRKA
ncbi:MAG: molybdopterin-dependent oxidoreductase [Dehalococcoidia bacterium]|nr:molybdopterin-dependent oxidoreductase [Dehalococcoidia bacterium]